MSAQQSRSEKKKQAERVSHLIGRINELDCETPSELLSHVAALIPDLAHPALELHCDAVLRTSVAVINAMDGEARFPQIWAEAHGDLAWSSIQGGRPDLARTILSDLFADHRLVASLDTPDLARMHQWLAVAHYQEGDPEAATSECRKALDLHAAGSDEAAIAACTRNLGVFLADQRDYDEALVHLHDAARLYRDQLGAGHSATAEVNCQIASILSVKGQTDEAEAMLTESLANLQSNPDAIPADFGKVYMGQSYNWARRGRFDRAEASMHEAWSMFEDPTSPSQSRTTVRLISYANQLSVVNNLQRHPKNVVETALQALNALLLTRFTYEGVTASRSPQDRSS